MVLKIINCRGIAQSEKDVFGSKNWEIIVPEGKKERGKEKKIVDVNLSHFTPSAWNLREKHLFG